MIFLQKRLTPKTRDKISQKDPSIDGRLDYKYAPIIYIKLTR